MNLKGEGRKLTVVEVPLGSVVEVRFRGAAPETQTRLGRVVEGLRVIQRSQPDAEICSGHDQISCGSLAETPPDDAEELLALGWRRVDGEDSWAVFT